MYLANEYIREEYQGIVLDHKVVSVNEAFQGEAFSLFLDERISDGFRNSIDALDDLSGETIELSAEDHLSKEQIEYLKKLDDNVELINVDSIANFHNMTFREVKGLL